MIGNATVVMRSAKASTCLFDNESISRMIVKKKTVKDFYERNKGRNKHTVSFNTQQVL